MIAAGENPKAMQTFMGHVTIQMTFDRYGHLFPGSRDQARARMDEYLAGFPTDFPHVPRSEPGNRMNMRVRQAPLPGFEPGFPP